MINFEQTSHFEVIEAFSRNHDPHHSAIPPKQIKQILSANILIRGPRLLRPSLDLLLQKFHSKKIQVEILREDTLFYTNDKNTNFSHFWLYPKISCRTKKQIKKGLIQFSIPIKQDEICSSQKKIVEIEKSIKKLLSKKQVTLILSHDTFSAYLKKLGFKIIILMHPGQHHHINLDSLKKIEQLRNKKNYWIVEKLSAPSKYKKSVDKSIAIDIFTELPSILKSILIGIKK